MPHTISSLVATIEKLLIEGAEYSQYLDPIHNLVSIAPLSFATNFAAGTRLFRATNYHTGLPRNIDEIWYPPEGKASLGRANQKGQSVFYCSSDPSCVFHEIGTKLGDLAVLATWETTTPMLLHELGYSEEVLRRAGSKRSLPKRHAQFNRTLKEENFRVRELLFLAFTDPTPAKYALTAAISEYFSEQMFLQACYTPPFQNLRMLTT